MNEAIRRMWMVAVAFVLVLLVAGSTIQVVLADQLKDDPLNRRQIYLEYGAPRGPILVDGEPYQMPTEAAPTFANIASDVESSFPEVMLIE